jgi:Flp pilus assembly protein TadG
MRYVRKAASRSGATLVETAVVVPISFLLIFGIMVGAMLVFKQHEVAHIARETARYASVHGGQYSKINAAKIQAKTLPTVNYAYLVTYAQNQALTIPGSQLSTSIQMSVIKPGTQSSTTPTPETVAWDNADTQNNFPYSTWTSTAGSSNVLELTNNNVSVTVSHTWISGIYLLGGITLTSTATVPMQY